MLLIQVSLAASLAVLAASSMPRLAAAAEYRPDGSVIGGQRTYGIRADGSPPEVARRYDVGYTAITAANGTRRTRGIASIPTRGRGRSRSGAVSSWTSRSGSRRRHR